MKRSRGTLLKNIDFYTPLKPMDDPGDQSESTPSSVPVTFSNNEFNWFVWLLNCKSDIFARTTTGGLRIVSGYSKTIFKL
jgi:hypothetical protein